MQCAASLFSWERGLESPAENLVPTHFDLVNCGLNVDFATRVGFIIPRQEIFSIAFRHIRDVQCTPGSVPEDFGYLDTPQPNNSDFIKRFKMLPQNEVCKIGTLPAQYVIAGGNLAIQSQLTLRRLYGAPWQVAYTSCIYCLHTQSCPSLDMPKRSFV